jgi:carboxylate-amine ligase
MTDAFGEVARQQLTCGMHIHVAVDSPQEGVAVIDRIQPWLPVLTALSTNSPFYHSEDSGYASYRSILWGQWPTAGPVAAFGDLANYRRVQHDLIASGAALDDGMLYFDARLSANYPTVEIRVGDVCLDPGTAAAIAGLARALVETAVHDWRDGRPPPAERAELLRARAWRAARWGMTGELRDISTDAVETRPAWACVDSLQEHVAAALSEFGDSRFIERELSELRRVGTGAQRQRAAHAAGGYDAVFDLLTVSV